MRKTRTGKPKDWSGVRKEMLGGPNECGSCHYSSASDSRHWYCHKHDQPTSLHDSCSEYQEYAGNRPGEK